MLFRQIFSRLFGGSGSDGSAATVSQERIAAALRDRALPKGVQRPRGVRITDDSKAVMGSCFVIDGNTVKVGETTVRLMGICAPEPDQPFGREAKWTLHHLCKDEIVTAQITDQDEKGRAVATCYLQDGRDVAAELVKQGLALDWPYFSNGKYAELEPKDARKTLSEQDQRQKEFSKKTRRRKKAKMPA